MLWQLVIGAVLLLVGLCKLIAAGIFFSFLLIYLGTQFIFGFSGDSVLHECRSDQHNGSYSTWLGRCSYNLDDTAIQSKQLIEFKTVFGKSKLDFSSLSSKALASQSPVIINIDTVFGSTILKLNKELPVRIFVKGALGKTSLPDGTGTFFGSHVYNNNPKEQPLLIINCSTAFGSIKIKTNE